MNCTSIEILPDKVLGTILVLVADFPAPANAWDTWNKYSEPFPIAAGRVSRRWRKMTLSYPELWTTIRISRHSFTRKLAALFVKRSGSYPLDISINLECYIYKNGRPFVPAFLSLSRVLAIIGPHVGRWRTIALHGWDQLQELATFLRNSPVPASRLEYAHLSTPDYYGFYLTEPLEIVGNKTLHTLRLDSLMLYDGSRLGVSLLRNLRSLDLAMNERYRYIGVAFFQQLFGPSCRITTFILRRFCTLRDLHHAIEAPTISSFSVSFGREFYFSYLNEMDPIKNLTENFSFPNLERLELVVQSPPEMVKFSDLVHPQSWSEPPFPNLHILRLEGIRITPRRLALLQTLSREITQLELINTSGNHHLLSRRSDGGPPQWPFLHSLTVESVGFIHWLPAFVALRAGLGPGMAPVRLMLPPSWRVTLPPELAHICIRGTSRGLADGLGRGFFTDDFDFRPVDFEFVEPARELGYPDDPSSCFCSSCRAWRRALRDKERVEVEIEEALKTGPALKRMKNSTMEARNRRRKSFALTGRRSSKQHPDISEDFWIN
ncbi:hypothetical protein DFH08DRAFT_959110 [Mycena albidolilacea]|uniref:F-box domain-containing protein n=1 Tax=Mycena albidolilacea TaxID=1033008 RepID=A0AAD7ERU5_9AGAR|nr:hypothetical protein DFH08DRAFT_959110 [Mycena albidolilacea]